eukprot:evm.model.NODE_35309_length_51595_cov_30.695145.6
MAELLDTDPQPLVYWDRKQFTNFQDQINSLRGTKVVYIGNLSFQTTEPQIHQAFSKVGTIKRVIMGLNRFTKEPCGFCFVEYFDHQCALDAVAFLHGTTLDERIVRVELDWGYHPSRRYGRGESGGQVRDEKRLDYDEGRGGYGRAAMYQSMSDPLAEAPIPPSIGKIGAQEAERE